MASPERSTDDLGLPRGDTEGLTSPRHQAETDEVSLQREATRRTAPLRGETDDLPAATARTHSSMVDTDGLGPPPRATTEDLPGQRTEPRPAPRGRRIGDYEVLAPIGAGGMGVVYRARDASGREVALKLVKLSAEVRQERFRREAELLARFNHPGVLRVHGFGELEGQAWIASELLEGALPLNAGFRERTLAERVELIAEVAETLGVVHAAGVVHRDVKPENLLLTRDGRVRVTDFGISLAEDQERLTKTGQVVGTAHYLSPEQAEGRREIGPRTDVWALGVILYEAMTGRLPFEGTSLIELFGQITSANFDSPRSVAPDLPRGLERICLQALALDPGDRLADGSELGRALRDWLAGRGPGEARSWIPWLAVGLVGLVLGGLVLAGVGSQRGGGAPPIASESPRDSAAQPGAPAGAESATDLVAPGLLRDGLPSELVKEAERLEAMGAIAAAGRCYRAAARKRPLETFHWDWVAGATLGDPDCVEACLRELGGKGRKKSKILRALARAAQDGRPAGVEAMGLLLCTLDSGVEADFARGLAYLERVETPRAQGVRGRLGRLGCGGLDRAQAEALLQKAAAGGVARAHRELALEILSGPLGSVDEERALASLRDAARGGDEVATRWLDEKRRAKPPPASLAAAGQAGDSLACLRLGDMYREGKVASQSFLVAHAWYRRAGQAPHAAAQTYLGLTRLHEGNDDPAGCLAWARRALAPEVAGPAGADYEARILDHLFERLRNLLKGDDPALEDSLQGMLARGRALDSPRTAYVLATIHDTGPRRDEVAAVAAFKWGAEVGQPECMVLWAESLRTGRGVAADPEEAYRWAQRAARQNERRGFRYLAFATYLGVGTPANPEGAIQIAREFVQQRPCSESYYTLGRLLVASQRVTEREEGLRCLRRSSMGAAKEALSELERVGARARLPLEGW